MFLAWVPFSIAWNFKFVYIIKWVILNMYILLSLFDILCMSFLSKASRNLPFYYKFFPQIYDKNAPYLKEFYFSYLQMTGTTQFLI